MQNIISKEIYGLHEYDSRKIIEYISKYINDFEFINTTITSPPYFDTKYYGSPHQLGYKQTYDEFLKDLTLIFKQIYKLTVKTGSLWIIADTFYRNKELIMFPFDIVSRLKKTEWIIKDIFVWKKDKNLPYYKKGNLRNIKEYILFFVKNNDFKFYPDRIREINPSLFKEWLIKYPERYHPKGILPNNIWEFPIPTQGSWRRNSVRHYNPLPYKLIERILLLTTDLEDIVSDPFAGIGTVLAVSNNMGRKAIGFELNTTYIDKYNNETQIDIHSEMNNDYLEEEDFKRFKILLTDKIIRLRVLKYSKIFLNKILKNDFINFKKNFKNVVFVNGTYNIEKYYCCDNCKLDDILDVEITFIIESNIDNVISNNIENVKHEAPLSKYEINPKISFIKYCDFDRYIKERNHIYYLCTYLIENVYKYDKEYNINNNKINIMEDIIKEYGEKTIILSNVKNNEKINKTWLSKTQKIKKLIIEYNEK